MSSTVFMERTGTQQPMAGYPAFGVQQPVTPTTTPMGPNYLMVPRCTFKVEKCTGGFKCWCNCDDKVSCSMMQNLCTMLAGGMCNCCCTWNGLTVCNFNFTVGHCRCEITEEGCCYVCTSGDQKCCEILQAFCDCLSCCLDAGCTCYFMQNNTPVCCGCNEHSRSGQTTPVKQAQRK